MATKIDSVSARFFTAIVRLVRLGRLQFFPAHPLHDRGELVGKTGLRAILVGSGIESALLAKVCKTADDEDGDIRRMLLLYQARDFVPGDLRHREIQDRDI